MTNPIQTENALPGTTAWQWTANKINTAQIACYVEKTSYNASDVVTIFASTQVGGTTWTGTIFRLGWYQGSGARLMAAIPTQTGVAQGYWDGATLHNCPTQIFNSTTHNLEAGWASSYTWTIPSNAVTGIYLILLTDANGWQSYRAFVVKGNTTADFLYVRADTTDCAYNSWGGFSLYTNPTVDVQSSFNKPDVNGGGSGGVLEIEFNGIKWLERQGYNLSYVSMTDVHVNASQLISYKAILSPGHNEYWTKAIRDGWETAIASGVSAAFLGANASYWQCRLDTDNAGNANRTVTCYKVQTSLHNLANDPEYGVDNTMVTAQWRDAVLGRPENTMVGIMYSDLIHNNVDVAWTVDSNADTTYFTGTGLVKGTSYGCDVVGYEYDNIHAGGPSNLKTLATTSVLDVNGNPDTHNSTYYIAPSGALVFATGAIDWTRCLDTYRWSFQCTPYTVPQMQQLFANILNACIGKYNMGGVSTLAFHA